MTALLVSAPLPVFHLVPVVDGPGAAELDAGATFLVRLPLERLAITGRAQITS